MSDGKNQKGDWGNGEQNDHRNGDSMYERRMINEISSRLRLLGDNLNNSYEQRNAVEQPIVQDIDIEEIVHRCLVVLIELYNLFWER